MRGESACSDLVRMKYGSFDDYRMRFFSWGGRSFLSQIKQYEEQMKFMRNFYKLTMTPKFNSRIGEIV